MSSFLAFLLAIVLSGPANTNAAHWAYIGEEDPEHWPEYYPTCGGSRQSPIDIVTESVVYNATLTDFTLNNFDNSNNDLHWSFTNNGHTVVVNVIAGEMTVAGGGLDGPYVVAQYHFHWGSTSLNGSEHTVDGKRYPMEMHIVSYKKAYGNMTSAVNYGDGLAVLGFFMEVANTKNAVFDNLVSLVPNITVEGAYVDVLPVFSLEALLPADINNYYRYLGSLTTPPCSEVVVWTVFQETIKVSEAQLEAFRTLAAGQPSNMTYSLSNNFRPVQPLKGRQVSASFEYVPTSADSTTTEIGQTTKKSSASTDGLTLTSTSLLLLSQLLAAFLRP